MSRMLEPVRMSAWFSGTVSVLALLIAATGIYGMLSYHVLERTSEIGIRMALTTGLLHSGPPCNKG